MLVASWTCIGIAIWIISDFRRWACLIIHLYSVSEKNLYPPKNVDIMTKKAFIHKFFIPTYCTFSRDSIQLSKNLLYHGPLHTHLSIYSTTHFLVKFMKSAFNLPVVHNDPFLPCERASKTLKWQWHNEKSCVTPLTMITRPCQSVLMFDFREKRHCLVKVHSGLKISCVVVDYV